MDVYVFLAMETGSKNHTESEESQIKDVGFHVGKNERCIHLCNQENDREWRNFHDCHQVQARGRELWWWGEERTLGFENIILVFIIFGFGLFLSIIRTCCEDQDAECSEIMKYSTSVVNKSGLYWVVYPLCPLTTKYLYYYLIDQLAWQPGNFTAEL